MANTVISNVIKEKIENLLVEDNSIVILKGIPLASVDPSAGRIDVTKAVENKMG